MKNQAVFARAEEEIQKGLIEAFELLDNNGNGYIEAGQLKSAMKVLGFEPSTQQLLKIISTIDRSGKGIIRQQDFLRVMTARFYDTDTKQEIKDGYLAVEDSKQGRITLKSLFKASNDLGETMTEDEIERIIAECDKDGDGGISYQEFLRVVKKTTPVGE